MSVKIFFCYAHEDELLLNRLKAHLIPLQRQGLIATWHDRDISAGDEWEQEIKEQLDSAQIILLLVSPDFMASDYCYGIELKRAIERHNNGEAHVIPIILRHTLWEKTPLGKLQCLPTSSKPVVEWRERDKAFLDISSGIQKAIEDLPFKTAVSTVSINERTVADTHIVVVDDSPYIVSLITVPLRIYGFSNIHTFFDGYEAWEFISQNRVDIILLDLMMSRIGGIEILHRLKLSGAKVKIIVISNANDLHIVNAISLGVVGFIRKPFRVQQILEGIQKALEGKLYFPSYSDEYFNKLDF